MFEYMKQALELEKEHYGIWLHVLVTSLHYSKFWVYFFHFT